MSLFHDAWFDYSTSGSQAERECPPSPVTVYQEAPALRDTEPALDFGRPLKTCDCGAPCGFGRWCGLCAREKFDDREDD